MRNLVKRIVILAIALTAFFGMTAYAATAEATAAFDKVNEIRVANGMSALTWDASLEQAAQVGAAESSTVFSHTRPDGSAWYTVNENVMYGENLAKLYNNADDVVNGWMNSAAHKANILKADYKTGAIAVYNVNGQLYWAEEFGY